jgi:hypothetical protein
MKVHRRSGDHIRRPQTSTSFGGISASQIMQNRGSLWPFLKGSVLPFLDTKQRGRRGRAHHLACRHPLH